MTNGDMVRKMFPDFEVKAIGDTILLERYEPYGRIQFSREYWNAQHAMEYCNSEYEEER